MSFGSYHLINEIFIILIDLFGVWLALWVYSANPKDKSNQLFMLLTLSILSWVSAGYFLAFSKTISQALFWARFAPSAVFVFLALFYFFSSYFPVRIKRHVLLDKIVLLMGILFPIMTFFSGMVVNNVEFTDWGTNPIFTPFGKVFFYLMVILLTSIAAFLLFRKYSILSKEEKIKVQYFIIGLSIFVLMNLIFNVFLPLIQGSIKYWQFGNYSAIFLLGFTAYAIVKRQLFGIRVVLTEILVGAIGILLFLQIFASKTKFEVIWKTGLLVLFLIFGYSLVKSVIREIRYREQLQRAYERLKVLDEAKSEFISIASHQLRTPLTAIKGYISMILDGDYGKIPEEAKKPLEGVFKSNERLIKLVNDLLNLSRIESGRIKLEKTESSLEEIIKSVIEELKIEADKKGIYLKFEKPKEEIPKLFLDADKIRNVILNIIDNSIRYTEKGGVTAKLERVDSKFVRVIISDTGAGITKDEISKIFQSFSRAAAGTKFYTEGAGLGLYIARKFVELHGGKIWVESAGRGKGSTFYIELPVKQEDK